MSVWSRPELNAEESQSTASDDDALLRVCVCVCVVGLSCVGRFRCSSSKCIQISAQCDGQIDCDSGEDELGCGEGALSHTHTHTPTSDSETRASVTAHLLTCVSASEWAELGAAGAEGRSLEDGLCRGLEQLAGGVRLQAAGLLQVPGAGSGRPDAPLTLLLSQLCGVLLRASDLHRGKASQQPDLCSFQPVADHQTAERHRLQVGTAGPKIKATSCLIPTSCLTVRRTAARGRWPL